MTSFDDTTADELRRRRSAKWTEACAEGPDMLAASVADMDLPVAPEIVDTLEQMLAASDLGYPSVVTPDGLPSVFARRMRTRFDWEVDPQRVEVLTDVVQGLHLAIEAFSDEGDPLITPTPVYPPFLKALRVTRRTPAWQRFVASEDGYRIDIERLRTELVPGTRMLLVCNPHNPTGRVLREDELAALAAIAIERDLVIVSDEIHAELVFPGARHVPIARLSKEVAARTITLTSATKAFNIAGLRCAVAVFGSEEMQRRFRRVHPHLRGGLNTMGLAATEAAWSHCDRWQSDALAYLDENRRIVAERVRSWPGVVHFPPEATYLSWLDMRALALEPTPQRFFIEHARVMLSAGEDFGEQGRGFARLNFATPRPVLVEILDRMGRALGIAGTAAGVAAR